VDLKHWKKFVGPYKGKYCFGDEITMADVFMVPQVQGASERFKIDLALYPNLQTILKNLQAVKEFEDAHPKNQPDFTA